MTEETQRQHIFIVDDHPIVRRGLAALLEAEPEWVVCGEAGSAEEALAAIPKAGADVLIIDLSLPDQTGLDVIRELRKQSLQTPALVLSMHDESTHAERALRAGAQGYVMKERADDVLVEALKAVLQGRNWVSEAVSQRLLQRLNDPDEEEEGVAQLTDRELDVFKAIGRGLATKTIADELGLSSRTVEVHRAHIKKKLGCENASQVVREAVRWLEGQL